MFSTRFRLAITFTDVLKYLTLNKENFAKSIGYRTIIEKYPGIARDA